MVLGGTLVSEVEGPEVLEEVEVIDMLRMWWLGGEGVVSMRNRVGEPLKPANAGDGERSPSEGLTKSSNDMSATAVLTPRIASGLSCGARVAPADEDAVARCVRGETGDMETEDEPEQETESDKEPEEEGATRNKELQVEEVLLTKLVLVL